MKMKKSESFRTLTVKFDNEHETPRQLFMKRHKVREITEDRPPDLTLLVANIPPYCTEASIKSLFSQCGTVKNVMFSSPKNPSSLFPKTTSKFFEDPEPGEYKVAYVVFSSAKELDCVLSWDSVEPVPLSTEECPIITGYEKWYKEYTTIPDEEELQKEIDEYMKQYDEQMAKKTKEEKEAKEPDERGWVTITKSGKHAGFARKRASEENPNEDRRKRRKKKKRELLNFYNFQIKEAKMKHLCELRERFEKDKQKVEELKARRKFKPF